MRNRIHIGDSTWTAAGDPPRELVDVLDRYLAELEQGKAPDQQALLAAHPELARELRPYFESLDLLYGATQEFQTLRLLAGAGDNQADSPKQREASVKARQIGDYRIIREIGRGGMGIVYEAHQISLNRRVALKILPFAAVLDQRQIARFRNEAQAAAQLHHAHIVPVFAVGQEQGVYYYAMQYIEGQSLEQALGEMRQDVERRNHRTTKVAGAGRGSTTTMALGAAATTHSRTSLRNPDLFLTIARLGKQAADALQHAHEYGIVHRDIKPSNLLLDGHGKLWVTDFGLARIQSDNGVTLTGDVVGTLRYMSPEQASGQSSLVDARSDVYSLGVTLYELITHQPPFPADNRQALLQQIVGEEPIAPRRINPAIPVDLETIVLGAMAKSRDERYASAQALADDLERFLVGKPTLARRPTVADRVAKWAKRHRSLVALAGSALVLLTIVSVIGVVLLAREQARTTAALEEAESNALQAQHSFERAERHFKQARSAVDQLGVRISDRLAHLPGAEAVRRDLLIDTLGYYHQFAVDAGEETQLQHELALTHSKSGAIASQLGAADHAIREYEAAIKLFDQIAAGETNAAEPLSQLAVTHNNLALLLAGRGEVEAARKHYDESIAIARRLTYQYRNDPIFASQLAESQANLGMLLDQTGDAVAAEKSLRAAIDVLRHLSRQAVDEPKYQRHLAIVRNNLSYVLRTTNRSEAEHLVREAIDGLERLAEEQPDANGHQEELALCYNNLAALHAQWGQLVEAAACYQRAIGIAEQLTRKSPAVVRYRSDLATTLNNLGVAHCRANRTDEADVAFGRARDLLATLAEDYPDEIAYQSSLAALLNNQALALAETGRHDAAITTYAAAIESQRLCHEQWSESSLMGELLSKMYYNYARSLQATQHYEQALAVALKRRDLWQGNSERLIAIAAEMTELARVSQESAGPQQDSIAACCENEALTILWHAYEAGWPADTDPTDDPRFANLRKNPKFIELVEKLSRASTKLNHQSVLGSNS